MHKLCTVLRRADDGRFRPVGFITIETGHDWFLAWRGWTYADIIGGGLTLRAAIDLLV